MLEQARQSRERAAFYRKLAETLGGNRSAFEVAKCARDLEQRATMIFGNDPHVVDDPRGQVRAVWEPVLQERERHG